MKQEQVKFHQKIKKFVPRRWIEQEQKEYKVTSARMEAIFGIAFSLLFYWAMNTFYDDFSFIKSNFVDILPTVNLSIYATIFFSVISIVFPLRIIKLISDIVSLTFTFVITRFLLKEYPFDFYSVIKLSGIDSIMRVVFVVILILMAIAVVVDFIKIIYYTLSLKIFDVE